MKKTYLLFLLSIFLFTTCSDDNNEPEIPKIEKTQVTTKDILGTWEYTDSKTGINHIISFKNENEESIYIQQKDGELVDWYKFSYLISDLKISIKTISKEKSYETEIYKLDNKLYFSDMPIIISANLAGMEGKTILTIGDSMSETGEWQNKVAELLGVTIKKHAKGGEGVIGMIDGNPNKGFPALSVADVTGVDYIVFFGGYNNRNLEHGQTGDIYPNNNTVKGIFQYALNNINDLLKQANNLQCKVILVTPHCAGKYNWCDADGYQEWPTGSGRTLEMMGNTIKEIAKENSLNSIDLWHNSSIDKSNWNLYQKSPVSANPDFTLIGEFTNLEDLPTGKNNDVAKVTSLNRYDNTYVHNGTSWVRYNVYPGSPFPYNADQLHLNADGYAIVGDYIAGSILIYNNK